MGGLVDGLIHQDLVLYARARLGYRQVLVCNCGE